MLHLLCDYNNILIVAQPLTRYQSLLRLTLFVLKQVLFQIILSRINQPIQAFQPLKLLAFVCRLNPFQAHFLHFKLDYQIFTFRTFLIIARLLLRPGKLYNCIVIHHAISIYGILDAIDATCNCQGGQDVDSEG